MKKSNFKFNFVDCAIVLLLAIAVVVTSVAIFSGVKSSDPSADSKTSEKTKEFTYELLFRELSEEVVDAIKKGTLIYDGSSNAEIGKISDLVVKETSKYEFNALTGEYEYVAVPGKYDITMKVSAKGIRDKFSYFIDEYEIYIGRGVDIKGLGYVAHGYVISVN